MSMTLILWKAPVVGDADEAKALLTSWYKSGEGTFGNALRCLQTTWV